MADPSHEEEFIVQRWKEAEAAYHSDKKIALSIFHELVEYDVPEALDEIGRIYESFGGSENEQRAIDYYQRSIEKIDSVYGHIGLGRICLNRGDTGKAVVHLEKGVAKEPGALFGLGIAHSRGIGDGSPDLAKAKHYYQLATDRGHIRAAIHLAKIMIRHGPRLRGLYLLIRSAYQSISAGIDEENHPRMTI